MKREVSYSSDKKKGLDRLGKKIFLNNYHKWLEKKRLEDKKKLTDRSVVLANYYIAKGKCPYCKLKFAIMEEGELITRICKKHGILGVKKKSWRIWKDRKYNKGEKK